MFPLSRGYCTVKQDENRVDWQGQKRVGRFPEGHLLRSDRPGVHMSAVSPGFVGRWLHVRTRCPHTLLSGFSRAGDSHADKG